MDSIKRIVEDCGIDYKRKRLEDNKRNMLMIRNMMSKLCFHQEVARYAYDLDYEEYYAKKGKLTPEEDLKRFKGQVEMSLLEDEPNVKAYIELRDELLKMDRECRDYYRTINVDFREELRKTHLPNLFVYQGILDSNLNLKLSRHIIFGNVHEANQETPNMVIYPKEGDISSKRDARHFYSRVSFQYLEHVSQDYTFDPKVKKLGRVDIR